MHDIIPVLLIAIALSMDTFSASLSLGALNIEHKTGIIISFMVGIMHFIMPLLGMFVGKFIFNIFPFKPDFVLGIIFLVLTFKMSYDVFINHNETIELSILGILLFSISVSADAFTTGIGLLAITSNILFATIMFSVVSFLFTISAIMFGRYINYKFNKISSILGIIILLIMSLYLII